MTSAREAVRVSVVTLVKGRYAQLGRLIEGLQRSSVPPAEFVVVDMEGAWSPPHALPCPVRVLRMTEGRLPLARARNAGALAARHEHLLFLDVDCIPRRNLVPVLDAELTRSDGVICAEVRYLGSDAVTDGWTEEVLLHDATTHPVRCFPAAGMRRESNPGLFWSLAFGIRRGTFHRLGGFDDRFEGYGAEDTDFGFRADASGLELLFVGGTGAFHQYHQVFDPPLQHFDDIVRNARRFHAKWQVWPMRGWLLAFQAMQLIRFDEESITLLRRPDDGDLAAARSEGRF